MALSELPQEIRPTTHTYSPRVVARILEFGDQAQLPRDLRDLYQVNETRKRHLQREGIKTPANLLGKLLWYLGRRNLQLGDACLDLAMFLASECEFAAFYKVIALCFATYYHRRCRSFCRHPACFEAAGNVLIHAHCDKQPEHRDGSAGTSGWENAVDIECSIWNDWLNRLFCVAQPAQQDVLAIVQQLA